MSNNKKNTPNFEQSRGMMEILGDLEEKEEI